MFARTMRRSFVLATLWLAFGDARAQTEAGADSTMFIAVPADAAAPAPPRTALDHEVAAIRAAFSLRLAELTSAYREAGDVTVAAEIQREIAALKTALELDLLDLQLRLARERRDPEAVAELEAVRAAAADRLGDGRVPAELSDVRDGQEAAR